MSTIQTNLTFRVRKKASLNFYSAKSLATEKPTPETNPQVCQLKQKETPEPTKIKKIVELDSDDENIDLINTSSRHRVLKRTHEGTLKKTNHSSTSSDSDCSPSKITRMIRSSNLKRDMTVPSSPMGRLSMDGKRRSCADDRVDGQDENLHNARLALHTSSSNNLPGRSEELEKLESFLTVCLKQESSGTLYVSGPPGTGKTACLSNILQRPKFQSGFREVYVNCTSMRSAGSIYGRICQELHLKTNGHTEKSFLSAIDKHLASKHKMILLVLDEIDQLCNKKQSVLYTIFEWPARSKSNIVLVGIANALDLTDRILPRLQARCELKPQLMHFAPYSKQQIVEIFTERLKQETALDLFSPVAIQMLAGKVAAISGDVRRALDIGRRVVELASPKSVPATNRNNNKQKTDNAKPNSVVELNQVMSVLNDVYGASHKLESDMDDHFPLQQKLLLCSLLLMLNRGKNKDISIGRLHDVYKKVCKKRNIIAVDGTEFVGLCELVETRGIIRVAGKKEPRTRKIALQWDESEVTRALSDKQMISDILNDISCLGM